jgi:WD40 repeat protein
LEEGNPQAARVLEGHSHAVMSVAWSPDGKRLASGSWDNTVRVWEEGNPQAARVLEGHSHHVMCVAWSPEGKYLASIARDSQVKLWRADDGELVGGWVEESCRNVSFDIAFVDAEPRAMTYGDDDVAVAGWETGIETAAAGLSKKSVTAKVVR